MKPIYLLVICLVSFGQLWAQEGQRPVSGQVTDAGDRNSLPGVNVILKGSTLGTVTDGKGKFSLALPNREVTLVFSFIGYCSREFTVGPSQSELRISLEEENLDLEEVTVVSTGFQELPLERTTGSFVGISQELVDRRVTPNIIDRLEDITPGLIFNRDISGAESGENISIRGTSTLISSNQPLIVVDNLAYDGPLSSINPNDVKTMTVLKDAAAASIWGARAGNGVIVITTKSGSFNQAVRVNLTANLTVAEKSDPYYFPRMNMNSLVDKQLELYANNYYQGQLTNIRNPVVPPLAEAMYAFDQGKITQQELDAEIARLRRSDVRGDIDDYLRRVPIRQQYAINVSGGSAFHNYQVSAGWDTNQAAEVAADNNRLTLSTRQNWKFLKERVNISTGAYWVQSNTFNAMPETANLFPYDRLADDKGTPLAVYRDYSVRFKESYRDLLVLDWDYVPLEELGMSPSRSQSNDLRLFTELEFKIAEGFSFSANYQYWSNTGRQEKLNPLESYFVRDLINSLTESDGAGGWISHVPTGGVLNQEFENSYSHNLRGHLNYEKEWNGVHRINALAGGEIKNLDSEMTGRRVYGYLDENGTSLPVDYLGRWPHLATKRLTSIPYVDEFGGRTSRFVSLFANLGYSYRSRYLFTGSIRKDASNLFGVNTNQKAVPLGSAGLGWILSEESFLKNSAFDFLKLRLTYGFNGNTNPNASALTTAYSYSGAQNLITRLPFLGILTPPNPELRWERVKIANAGVDFELKRSWLSGTLEYYDKKGLDLLGNIPLYPSSGFSQATLNYASTRTRGWDLSLNSINTRGQLKWETSFFLSLLKEEVVEIENQPTATQLISYTPSLPTPAVGRPLFSIYSFPFAGLDPGDGSPLGLVDGEPSKDYGEIFRVATPENILFHGSGRPTRFGALRNSLSFKGWSLSANISYRMGYYIRKPSVSFDEANRGSFVHADYEMRWRKPGDELITTVPSDPGRVDAAKTQFYLSSSAIVAKGDHIRLQDVRLSYQWPKLIGSKALVESLETYLYANNLGVIWKSAKEVRDPDFLNNQAITSLAFGFRASF